VTPQATEEQLERAVSEQTEEVAPEDVPRSYRERALEILRGLHHRALNASVSEFSANLGFSRLR